MAGEADAERLVVLLEARIRDFEKNMAKASGTADRSYSRMRRDSRSATRQLEQDMVRSTGRINQALAATGTKIGAFGKAMVAGFVAGGVAGFVTQIGGIARDIATIGDEAKMAGLSAKAFQELAYVAKINRIEVGALTDGMKELNLRADEFVVTGGGSAAEAFKRLGYGANELNEKLKDPSALFTEIIGKLGQLDRAAAIRIADEIFGGQGGERFVQLIDQGADGIRRTIEEAHTLGAVIDDEMIAKADTVNRKFEAISTTVGMGLKGAIVDAAFALQQFIDKFNSVQNQQLETLEARMRELGLRRVQIENSLIANPRSGRGDTRRSELLRIAEEEAKVLAEYQRRQIITSPGEPPRLPAPPPVPTVPGSGSPSREREITELERQKQAVTDLIAGLEFEKSLIGLSAVEQQKLTTLRQAGAAATGEQREEIARLVEETVAEQQRVESLQAAYDQLRSIGESALNSLIDAMADGKVEGEEFLGILSNIASQLGQMFISNAFNLMGGGGFNIGSLFGFASGTANTGGRRGEPRGVVHGQEAVIPLPAGGKVPVEIKGASGSTTSTTTVNFAPKMTFQGSVGRSDVEAAMRIAKREFRKELPAMLADARKRGEV